MEGEDRVGCNVLARPGKRLNGYPLATRAKWGRQIDH